jgi:uncharacterized membrane protein YeiH
VIVAEPDLQLHLATVAAFPFDVAAVTVLQFDFATIDAFALTNVIGLLAFAVVGAMKAIDADFDLLGIAVLGVMTALGGGTTRDLLVGRVPTALQSTTDVSVALVGVVLAVLLAQVDDDAHRSLFVLLPDAIGLAAFAATGALVGHAAGVSPFGVVILATVTAVGGGTISDLLLQDVPFVLCEDFYATCAVVGGAAFVVLVAGGVAVDTAAIVGAALVFGMRVLAMQRGWELPTVG